MTTARHEHGFTRTVCDCAFCQAPCKHIPGSLDVIDLTRLCPPEKDIFAWSEEHLRAVVDKPYPTLVPARGIDGCCHWLFDGKCVVHENAPYSCAFFDMHMTEPEIERRTQATIRARAEDARQEGLYTRLWLHLRRRGLLAPSGDRAALAAELQALAKAETD